MSVVLDQLVQPATVFMVAALVLGGVFDRLPPGRHRDAVSGLTCGVAAAVLIGLGNVDLGFGDGRGPLVLVGAYFGGVAGLPGLLLPPLVVVVAAAEPDAAASALGLLVLAAAGLAVHLAERRLSRPRGRPTVLLLAALSPLAFVGNALAPARAPVDPLSFWLPFGTLLFGFAVATEQARNETKRTRRAEVRFRELTDTVSVALFKSQLEQHFRMHQRYGHEYGYMLVSIDAAAELRKRADWDRVRAAVATTVRRTVREPDVCAAVAFDRIAVILPHASLPFALPVAERVQKAVADAMAAQRLDVSVSIGVSEVDGTQSPDEIEAAAEAELFLANMRQPKAAIGPWMDWPAAASRLPAADGPPAGERRLRTTRLVPLEDASDSCAA